jgi:hypothetical protein
MTRTDIIQALIDGFKLKQYLEVGVFNGENFDKIRCEVKHSVDPNFPATFKVTSDHFFSGFLNAYDIIFIDGLHTAEQTYKDIVNAYDILLPGGFIVVHDCNPATEWHTRPAEEYTRGEEWNGTTYQGFIKFKEERTELSCFTVDADYGCGIITDRAMLHNVNCNKYYDYFEAHRGELLQLIDKEAFLLLL